MGKLKGGIVGLEAEITIILQEKDLELLILCLENNRNEDPRSVKLRKDLKFIRSKVEKERNKRNEKIKTLPTEEEVLMSANPTSAEHVK